MAELKVCSIYDEKAEMYLQPAYYVAIGQAHRDFVDGLKEGKMSAHKSDFAMYHVANFESRTGLFESVVPPRLIVKGTDLGE